MSKLSLLYINLIGLFAALILFLVLFFVMIKPKQEDVQKTKVSTKSTEDAGGTVEKVKAKDKELKSTQQQADKTKEDWQVNSVRYMPSFNFGNTDNLLNTYWSGFYGKYGVKDVPEQWTRFVTGWYDAQHKYGVSRLPGVEFSLAGFPADPNNLAGLKSLSFPQDRAWTVSMECKTFDEAMAHLKRFNNMEKHGMPVIDNVALSGQSPNLTLNYTMRLYVIPSENPPKSDPRLASGVAGGAAGGNGMGGGGMSMMGGMGGMMGAGGGSASMGGGGATSRATPAAASPAAASGDDSSGGGGSLRGRRGAIGKASGEDN